MGFLPVIIEDVFFFFFCLFFIFSQHFTSYFLLTNKQPVTSFFPVFFGCKTKKQPTPSDRLGEGAALAGSWRLG